MGEPKMEGVNKSEKEKSLEFGGSRFILTLNEDGKTYYAVYNNSLGGSNIVPLFDPGLSPEELEEISKKEEKNSSDQYLPETVELLKKMMDRNFISASDLVRKRYDDQGRLREL